MRLAHFEGTFALAFGLACAASLSCEAGTATDGTGGGTADTTTGSQSSTTATGGGAGTGGSTGSFTTGAGGATGSGGGCVDVPANLAGAEAVLAPEYASEYTVYDLGVVPGMPSGHLGGCVIKHDDPNTLLIAGDSEAATGTIYSIQVERGPCGHIIGFIGSATLVATTEYVDANLVYGPNDVLFYTQWPTNMLSQLLPGQSTPAATLDASTIGIVNSGSVSGFGFVPPSINAAANEPRTVTWSNGDWYRMALSGTGPTYTLSSAVKTATLTGGPGGFAYVPAGSPAFDVQSLIVAEWSVDTVASYEVDSMGDPIVSTRKPFFTAFPKPWGAYFEPETGDFLFLTWGSLPDRVYVVQGFTPPPPPPPPPQ